MIIYGGKLLFDAFQSRPDTSPDSVWRIHCAKVRKQGCSAIATRRSANDKDSSESVPDTVARRFHNTVRLPDFSNHGLKKSGEIDVIQSSDVELFRTLLLVSANIFLSSKTSADLKCILEGT